MHKSLPRVSLQGLKVLGALIDGGPRGLSGADITRATGAASGTLYPILFRYEKAGWLRSEWEPIDPAQEGRPRRRFYWLTAEGKFAATREWAKLDGVKSGVGRARLPKWA